MTTKYYSDFLRFDEPGDLSNYYFFKHAFSADEADGIVALGRSLTSFPGIAGGAVNKGYRSSNVSWIPLSETNQWIFERCGKLAMSANKALWNFSVSAMTEKLQFAQYFVGEGGHYDWHMDLGKSFSKRKISLVVQLTDPDEYQGGNLEIRFGRDASVVPRGRGHVAVFPSYALHRVTPVTQGQRQSLVVWVSGEPFR